MTKNFIYIFFELSWQSHAPRVGEFAKVKNRNKHEILRKMTYQICKRFACEIRFFWRINTVTLEKIFHIIS